VKAGLPGCSSGDLGTVEYQLNQSVIHCVHTTGSPLADASDCTNGSGLQRWLTYAVIGWLTNQNTDWCFVVIGLVQTIPQSFAVHLKIDPVGYNWSTVFVGKYRLSERMFIYIDGQYAIQKNIYIVCPYRPVPPHCQAASLVLCFDTWVQWLAVEGCVRSLPTTPAPRLSVNVLTISWK